MIEADVIHSFLSAIRLKRDFIIHDNPFCVFCLVNTGSSYTTSADINILTMSRANHTQDAWYGVERDCYCAEKVNYNSSWVHACSMYYLGLVLL